MKTPFTIFCVAAYILALRYPDYLALLFFVVPIAYVALTMGRDCVAVVLDLFPIPSSITLMSKRGELEDIGDLGKVQFFRVRSFWFWMIVLVDDGFDIPGSEVLAVHWLGNESTTNTSAGKIRTYADRIAMVEFRGHIYFATVRE